MYEIMAIPSKRRQLCNEALEG